MQFDNRKIGYKNYGMVPVVDKERLVITTEVNANFTKNAELGYTALPVCLSCSSRSVEKEWKEI